MSRLDTQSDRLVRGPGQFERQRSFLVQPQRFATGQVTPISEIVGRLAGAAKGINEINAATKRRETERKEKTDIITYNKLLESRNRANADPATYGDEFIEMYQSTLEGLDEDDEFRTRVLALDADNYVSSRVQAEEKTLKAQTIAGMRNTFISISDYYESMSEESRRDYAELPTTKRSERLYNEYLDSFLENNEDIHAAILKYSDLELVLREEVDRVSSSFDPQYDAMLKAKREVSVQQTVDGIVTGFETTSKWDQSAIQGLADRYGMPVENLQVAVLKRAYEGLEQDLIRGRYTLGDVREKMSNLADIAEGYGQDAESVAIQAQARFISTAMQHVSTESQGSMERSIADGTDLDQIIENSNEHLLSVLSDATGTDYPEGTDIMSVSTDAGFDSEVLANLRSQHSKVRDFIAKVERDRARNKADNVGSGLDEAFDAMYRVHIRNGDYTTMDTYGDTDGEKSLNAGRLDAINIMSRFSLNDKLGPMISESIVEGNPNEFLWAVGAVSIYNQQQFNNMTSGMPLEDKLGLMFIREELEKYPPDTVFTEDEMNTIRAQYSAGRELADRIEETGTNKTTTKLNQYVLKEQNLPTDGVLSQEATIQLQIYSTRFSEDLSEKERARLTSALMQAEDKVMYKDPRTGKYEIYDDPLKRMPQSQGVSSTSLYRDLDTVQTTTGSVRSSARAVLEYKNVPGSSFTTHTPILGRVMSQDLGIEVTSNETAIEEVAAQLLSKRLSPDTPVTPASLVAYKTLFTRDNDVASQLKLGVTVHNGRPFLVATGNINGHPYQGEDSLLLAPWNPEWNQAIGTSHEQVERALKASEVGVKGMAYLAKPGTLGNRGVKFLQLALETANQALDASAEARETTREVTGQTIRPRP